MWGTGTINNHGFFTIATIRASEFPRVLIVRAPKVVIRIGMGSSSTVFIAYPFSVTAIPAKTIIGFNVLVAEVFSHSILYFIVGFVRVIFFTFAALSCSHDKR